ncbi:MAG: TCR/Tet family MFS transporter [Halieaceae bacterium]|jgi:MFS transporter, DHA1 family, tetracycline resistance protein|nr:TCR/Tet family MFS transporter [Halieaceae bacterium]
MSNRLALGILFATVFLDSIGFGVILPVMPQLIMDITGEPLSSAAVYGGWLLVLHAAMQFLTAPVMGNLSDRVGRKPVLVMALFAFGLNYLLMGWAPTLTWLFVGRLLAGAVSSTYAVANAFIADLFPAQERVKLFALMGAAFGGGFVLGPALGGFLGEMGPRVPFYATGGLALANASLGFFMLPETLSPENRRSFDWRRANPLGALAHLRRYPLVKGLMLVFFLFYVANLALPSTWSYFTIAQFGWSEREIGFSLSYVGVLMIIFQGLVIRSVLDQFGSTTTIYIGLGGLTICFVGCALAYQSWMVYAFLLIGATQGFVGPAMQGLMSAKIAADAQGELQGMVASVSSLAAVISPLLMTHVFGFFTGRATPVYFPGMVYLVAAALAGLCIVLTGFVLGRELRARKRASGTG